MIGNEKEWYDEPLPASYLRLEQGKHEIKILGDPSFRSQEMDGKLLEKADFPVEYRGERTTWSVTKGSEKSVYGKLHALARKHGGLTGRTVVVRATGEKLNRQYWIELKDDSSSTPSGEELSESK